MCSSALLTFSLRVTSLRLQFGSDSLTATTYYLAVSATYAVRCLYLDIYILRLFFLIMYKYLLLLVTGSELIKGSTYK